jgi:predicted TIM-barrel fold metal-dependent hydrolase
MIQEFPNVNFIMAHFGVQTGGVYVFEPMQWAMELPNVYCESGWCLQSRIVEFAKVLPTHKILFGTDTPPNEPGMWLRLLEVLCHQPRTGHEPRRNVRGLPGQQHRPNDRHRTHQPLAPLKRLSRCWATRPSASP